MKKDFSIVQFLKFIFSSLSSSVVDIVLFTIFCHIFEPINPLFSVTLATVAARILSATYNFFINYAVVFKGSESVKKAIVKYVILAVIQMCCSAGLTTVFVFLIPVIPRVIIKVVVDGVLFVISFGIQKAVVFK